MDKETQTRRLKLTLAYNGAPYAGWQSQPNSLTVQDVLEEAIAKIAKQSIRVQSSGRTDTGVHADGQVVHFDSPASIDMNPFNWVPALNTQLPDSIRAIFCEEVSNDFHARFSATSKTYEYRLNLQPVLHPHWAGRAWHLPRQLDPVSLEQALNHYQGEHCFRAFAANRGNETEETNYVRTISKAELLQVDEGYLINYTGNGFLYKMVRLLTGAAVQVAQGRLRLDDHLVLLDQAAELPHGKSPYTAPAGGLTLKRVDYGSATA